MRRVIVVAALCAFVRAKPTSFRALELPPTCESRIYCQGQLLHTIQTAQIFNDSKTFVDMRIRNSVNDTLAAFDELIRRTNNQPSKQDIVEFVDNYFESGNELEEWIPPDFNPHPSLLDEITEPEIKKFASDLVEMWKLLGRKVRPEVFQNPDQYSLIPVPNGVIIPGGRFKEIYYWDSFWIIKGLLICEMHETVKGIINNFIHLVKTYGFVPNGGRVYYTQRSHPPLLIHMAYKYVTHTKDLEWLKENIKYLDTELKHWLDNKVVDVHKDGATYRLATYSADSKGPRPESYLEDVRTAAYFSDPQQQQEVYCDLKSGAQSGWDFTSRWIFDDAGGTNANLSRINTRRVVPVDLNSFLSGGFRHLSALYSLLDKCDESSFWDEKAKEWEKAISKVFWNETDGIWYDYDRKMNQQRPYFAASNLAPLWTNSYDSSKKELLGKRVVNYLYQNNIHTFLGGIPATLDHTGEQWDAPNAWAPLQAIVIQGLHNTGYKEAEELAERFAKNWVTANFIGYNKTGHMYEKYDAENVGERGDGGEYKVQIGFGWTNGFVFEAINQYYTNVVK